MTVAEPIAFTTGVPSDVRTLPARDTISGSGGLVTGGVEASSDWLHEVCVQIKELLLLDSGWDHGPAAAITSAAVSSATRFVTILAEQVDLLRRPYVTPTVNGGVNLEWHSGSAHFDVTFEDDEPWLYAASAGFEWEGPLVDVSDGALGVLLTHFVA